MTTNADLRELEQRPKRYWNVDGIPELMMGLVWMVWGAALIYGEALPKGRGSNWYWMVVPMVLVLSGVVSNWAVKKLKERLTYPRTGWVEMKEPSRGVRQLAAGIAVVSAGALAAMIVTGRVNGLEHTATPGIGLVLSLSFVIASIRQKAPHMLALAAVALVLGFSFGMLKLGWESLSWMFLWLGLAAALVGGWRLRRYLAANRMPEGEGL